MNEGCRPPPPLHTQKSPNSPPSWMVSQKPPKPWWHYPGSGKPLHRFAKLLEYFLNFEWTQNCNVLSETNICTKTNGYIMVWNQSMQISPPFFPQSLFLSMTLCIDPIFRPSSNTLHASNPQGPRLAKCSTSRNRQMSDFPPTFSPQGL